MATQSIDVDFIGKLPNCVLHRIVSLLPYKEAARTTTLASRWRYILPRERLIDVDERALGLGFQRFAKDLVENYEDTCMDKLSLTLTLDETSPEDILPLVSLSAEKKAKVVLLDFSSVDFEESKFDLPLNFYENPSLETLKLYSCRFNAFRFRGFADSLLDLSLGFMELSGESLETVVQNCLSLKSLSLRKCWNMTRVFEVKSRVLESLTIEDCGTDIDSWVTLETSRLKRLKYSGSFCTFDVYVTERLEEAVLDFGNESEPEYGHLLVELFKRNIDPVKVLTVCSYVLQTIPSGDKPLGIRRGLRVEHLILKTALHENEFFGVRFFLNTCYRLETLTVEVDPSRRIFEDYESPFEGSWARLPIYECVRQTLKVVNVKGYRGNDDAFSLLAYFVYAGRVMEELNVEMKCQDSQLFLQKAQMLQFVPKASPNLRISISAAE